MNTTRNPDVQLAPGFRFTDHLDAPYRLACVAAPKQGFELYTSRIDGSERQQFFDQTGKKLIGSACFSPDGTTLYWHDSHLWKQDIASGTIQMLPDVPKLHGWMGGASILCSPDNNVLLVGLHSELAGLAPTANQINYRLYRVSTQGSERRVLYEAVGDVRETVVVCSWPQGFAIIYNPVYATDTRMTNACKVDLNTGDTTSLMPLEGEASRLIIRPDGREIAWTRPPNAIYTRILDGNITRKLPISGMGIAWSPNGRCLAFMADTDKLCLWDAQHEQVQEIIQLAAPPDDYYRNRKHYATCPRWSPHGNMLWFTLSQANIRQFPRTLLDRLREIPRHLKPILHNLNPARASRMPPYRRVYEVKKTGSVDLRTRQIVLSDDYHTCLAWLPYPAAEQG